MIRATTGSYRAWATRMYRLGYGTAHRYHLSRHGQVLRRTATTGHTRPMATAYGPTRYCQ